MSWILIFKNVNYQYTHIMEEIIEELGDINIWSTVIKGDDKIKFKNEIADQLDIITRAILEIRNKVSAYKISDENIKEIDNDRKRQKIIWKCLFPQYWAINYVVNHATETEIELIEQDLKNK